MIKQCFCVHAWQDRKYGHGHRVCNEKKSGGYRCTVCGKDVGGYEPTKKK